MSCGADHGFEGLWAFRRRQEGANILGQRERDGAQRPLGEYRKGHTKLRSDSCHQVDPGVRDFGFLDAGDGSTRDADLLCERELTHSVAELPENRKVD